ncbi:MAG: PD-(D/E)XK nuclease family transposase [Deltaproteobacteria bacterium]|jgi:hypothetical protein|nr:PD-(D/E)XK nuclease family transposase [Deltaproteobacteria bacterium]
MTHPLGNRACYVDVMAENDANGLSFLEVQLYFDPAILQRNLLMASYLIRGTANAGTKTEEMAKEMPRILAINIFGNAYNCRKKNKELSQPIRFFYEKEPREVALNQFTVINVQLPYLPSARKDFTNHLYCWCFLLFHMHFNKKMPLEVYAMEPKIKEFVNRDPGAEQFVDRYGQVAASPEARKAYHDWMIAEFRERSLLLGAEKIGIEKGIEIGIEIGIEQAQIKMVKNALARQMPIEQIELITGLTRTEIEELQRR